MSNCNCCFEDYLIKCQTEIRVFAQTQPNDTITWVITDKFGREYSGEIQTDSVGFFTIPVTSLPAGLLTEFSGSFKLSIYNSDCKPIKFMIANEYDCINFTIRPGTREKNNLGCQF